MHTYEFQKTINRLFADPDDIAPFTNALSVLAQSVQVVVSHLGAIAEGGDKVNQGAGQIFGYLANAHRITSKVNNRHFFRALEHFQGIISQFQPAHTPNSKLILNLNAKVDEFAGLYDTFLSHQNAKSALPMILAAHNLHTTIVTLIDTLQFFEESVGMYDVPASSEASLAILLPEHLGLADFANRLQALQSLYSELCMLLSISESNHPLRISKIESGSLWAKVFGEATVVGLIATFMKETASWLYRTYTREGRLASIPRKIESIDSMLGLTSRLKEAGLDTSAIERHIEKSALALSKSLATLLDGQSSVTVNEQTISVGSEAIKILLERSAPPRLPPPDVTPSDEPSALPPTE